MYNNWVLFDDQSTRGGDVILASSTMIINDKKVVLLGAEISDQKVCYGNNCIVEGSTDDFSDKKAIVVHGRSSKCGCQVISGTSDSAIG